MLYYSEKHLTSGICPKYTCPIGRKIDACLGNLVCINSDLISVGPFESSYFSVYRSWF